MQRVFGHDDGTIAKGSTLILYVQLLSQVIILPQHVYSFGIVKK